MPDINLPNGIVNVKWQEEKESPDGKPKNREAPSEKVAESYEENSGSVSDKITVLGIPIDLMTIQVQSTIAGLVSEVENLKVRLKRYERGRSGEEQGNENQYLHSESFTRELEKLLLAPPTPGYVRELVLIVVRTYEDIRQSSGLLSANETLAEVATRIGEADLGAAPTGLIGGPTVAALLTRPAQVFEGPLKESEDGPTTAEIVRGIIESEPYSVAGLDMNLRFRVASVPVKTGQSPEQAIGQADHLLRS